MSFTKFAQEKDAASFREAFLETIQAAVADEIEQQKIAVAQSMFGVEEQQVEEEMTDEELDEILDSMSEEELEALTEEIEQLDELSLKTLVSYGRKRWEKPTSKKSDEVHARNLARNLAKISKKKGSGANYSWWKEEIEQIDERGMVGMVNRMQAKAQQFKAGGGHTGGAPLSPHAVANRVAAGRKIQKTDTGPKQTGDRKADARARISDLKNQRTYGSNLPEDYEQIDEVSPPGREKQVKALKKTGVRNPWAVAWASYNKSKK